MTTSIPVIDVFAGPGGLGEGFSALGRADGKQYFKIGVSVEKEASAHSTLELRSFFRQFPYNEVPYPPGSPSVPESDRSGSRTPSDFS